ncbi:MAG TPA: TauD/TfdA family dioxygenase [Herpetosiphonaceae bacterium]
MANSDPAKPGPKKPGSIQRKAVNIAQAELVKVAPLLPGSSLPLLVQPTIDGVNLIDWAAAHREEIQAHLLTHGGLLFRDFAVPEIADFEQFVRATSGNLLEYRERSSPRSQVSGNIYISTDYPADQPIFLHNENSYQHTWPLKIFFFCVTAAEQGGETPIADVRKVYQRIDPAIRARFARKGWMYVRNFGQGIGLPWQTVFQTEDKAAVEEYCRQHQIEATWREGDRLRTRAIREAVLRHPQSGELVWFNHATFFHVTTLSPMVRDAMLAEFSEEDLPANSYYGDGTPIEPEVVEALREAYHQETVSFPWQRGDILMLDNMLVAHGRAPFVGSRKVVVGMAEPVSRDDVRANDIQVTP